MARIIVDRGGTVTGCVALLSGYTLNRDMLTTLGITEPGLYDITATRVREVRPLLMQVEATSIDREILVCSACGRNHWGTEWDACLFCHVSFGPHLTLPDLASVSGAEFKEEECK